MWPLFAISWLFICQISFLFHNYWSETHKFIHEKALWKIVKKIYYKVHETALWFLFPSFRFIVHITYLTILNKVTEIENNKNLRDIFFLFMPHVWRDYRPSENNVALEARGGKNSHFQIFSVKLCVPIFHKQNKRNIEMDCM